MSESISESGRSTWLADKPIIRKDSPAFFGSSKLKPYLHLEASFLVISARVKVAALASSKSATRFLPKTR